MAFAIVPDPLINVHSPVPTAGRLPLSVAEVPHTLCATPASEVVGETIPVMVT